MEEDEPTHLLQEQHTDANTDRFRPDHMQENTLLLSFDADLI